MRHDSKNNCAQQINKCVQHTQHRAFLQMVIIIIIIIIIMTGKVRVNVSLRRVRVTIVVVEKEEELKKPVGVPVGCMGTCHIVLLSVAYCGCKKFFHIIP